MSAKNGLTVVEVTIVAALLLLVAAISVPAVRQNLQKKRAARCAVNLEALRLAAEKHAAEKGAVPRAPADLVPDFLGEVPACPSGGTYTLGASADVPPTCSIPGHHF